jgi:hypothetical protein
MELLALFGGLPLLVLYFQQRAVMIAVLWLGAIALYKIISNKENFSFLQEWNWSEVRTGMPQVLLHFSVAAALLAALMLLYDPGSFLSFPRSRPQGWIAVMFLYPLLSVWPQEIIYRSFFFHRYEKWLGSTLFAAILSAVSFGYMHIIFGNGVALVLSTAGGFIISRTYIKHRSLALVCIEHSLYGCLVFTIGLGRYFFSGAAWG